MLLAFGSITMESATNLTGAWLRSICEPRSAFPSEFTIAAIVIVQFVGIPCVPVRLTRRLDRYKRSIGIWPCLFSAMICVVGYFMRRPARIFLVCWRSWLAWCRGVRKPYPGRGSPA